MYILIYIVIRKNGYIKINTLREIVSYRGDTEFLSEHAKNTKFIQHVYTTHQ